jgi:hypothetical protein
MNKNKENKKVKTGIFINGIPVEDILKQYENQNGVSLFDGPFGKEILESLVKLSEKHNTKFLDEIYD